MDGYVYVLCALVLDSQKRQMEAISTGAGAAAAKYVQQQSERENKKNNTNRKKATGKWDELNISSEMESKHGKWDPYLNPGKKRGGPGRQRMVGEKSAVGGRAKTDHRHP